MNKTNWIVSFEETENKHVIHITQIDLLPTAVFADYTSARLFAVDMFHQLRREGNDVKVVFSSKMNNKHDKNVTIIESR